MLTDPESVGLPREVLVNLPTWGVVILLLFDRVKPFLSRQREQQAELMQAIETVESALNRQLDQLEKLNRRIARLTSVARTRRRVDRPDDLNYPETD
jgi:septal ring factor EnvC (AmiA/AmiB activator)